ncbi:MAG: ATP-dependent chaperone ClpB, partial [Alphaproteobacteria bacterium]|nr:ATP-dependent chaperone ClpB [Alphaproteobacteria bacterium]
MNNEILTDRSQGFIQSAQSLAVRHSNQFLMPEHLLSVMLDDKEGMASSLLAQSGADVASIRRQVEDDVDNLPQVQGSSVQVSASQSFMKVLDSAEQIAKKAKDAYITVERLLQALLAYKSYGVDVHRLNQVINDMRQGRTAETPTAEDSFDALKKYAMDYTERAT